MPKTPAPMLVPKMMPMVSRRLIGRARRPESVWAEPGRAGVFMGSPNADKDSRWGGRIGPGGTGGGQAGWGQAAQLARQPRCWLAQVAGQVHLAHRVTHQASTPIAHGLRREFAPQGLHQTAAGPFVVQPQGQGSQDLAAQHRRPHTIARVADGVNTCGAWGKAPKCGSPLRVRSMGPVQWVAMSLFCTAG